MSYEMKGIVKAVFDEIKFDSGFTKREFVISTDEQYPQAVKFETVRDKTAICNKFEEGDEITVHFDVRGNEYKGRYFVNLNCWKVNTHRPEKVDGEPEYATDDPPQDDGAENVPF